MEFIRINSECYSSGGLQEQLPRAMKDGGDMVDGVLSYACFADDYAIVLAAVRAADVADLNRIDVGRHDDCFIEW